MCLFNFQIKKVTFFSITGHLRPLHSGCEMNEQHENTKCLDMATERQEKKFPNKVLTGHLEKVWTLRRIGTFPWQNYFFKMSMGQFVAPCPINWKATGRLLSQISVLQSL